MGDEFTTYGNPPAGRPIHFDANGSIAIGSALANAFISPSGPEPQPEPDSFATLQFDFGTVATVNDPDASVFLNTLSGGAGAAPNDITNAIDSEGNQTTVGLAYSESNGSDSGVAGSARNYAGPFPEALSELPITALQDQIFSRDSPVQLTLSGLDNSLTYDLLLYGATDLVGLSQYTVTGDGAAQTLVLATQENATETSLFSGIAPNSNGVITIDLVSDNTTDLTDRGFAVLNTLVVTTAPIDPEPFLPGDVNRSGEVNFLDISGFVALLAAGEFQDEADIDRNNAVNFLDIGPFIRLLSGG